MRKPRVDRVVVLEWLDIQTDHGWVSTNEPLGPAPCKSVGVVAAVDDVSVTLAGIVGGSGSDKEHNVRQCIPWGCVTGWKYLNVA